MKIPFAQLPEAAPLTFDEASYRVFTRTLHGTAVVVAVHQAWDGVPAIPSAQAFAEYVFSVFALHWQVFCGYPADRLVVIVRPPSDSSETRNTRLGFVITGQKNHAGFRQYTGVIPHDVFHVWLRQIIHADTIGRTLRPIAPEAWFSEGVTAYYQHRAFVALGNRSAYFEGLNGHRRTYARLRGTSADLPFDQLADLASPPAPPDNPYTSMLDAKGALVAYLLERALLVQGRTLDDLMRYLYENFGLLDRGFRTSDVAAALQAIFLSRLPEVASLTTR